MAANQYTLHYTKTTKTIIERLESYGFNIRDVLNAGIILFEKANKESRGVAIAEALSQHKPELDESIERLKNVIADIRVELLSPEESQRVAKIRQLLSDSADSGEDRMHSDLDGVADNTKSGLKDKKHHNPVILRKSQ